MLPGPLRTLLEHRRTPAALAAASVLLAGAGLLGINAVDEHEQHTTGDGPRTTARGAHVAGSALDPSAESVASGAASAPDGATSGTDAASPSQAPRTAASPLAGPEPTTAPEQVAVTRPGTYRFKVTQTGDEQSERTTNLTVADAAGEPSEVRQQHRHHGDDSSSTLELSWRDDAAYIVVTTVGSGGFEIRCEHQPPLLQSPRTLRTGVRWTSENTCQYANSGGGTVTIKIDGEVVGQEQVDVAGRRVATWVVRTVVDFRAVTAFGTFDQHEEGPTWVDSRRGLIVRSDQQRRYTETSPGGQPATTTTRLVSEILNLDPR